LLLLLPGDLGPGLLVVPLSLLGFELG